MKSTLCGVMLSGTVLLGTLLPSTAMAQDQMRFRAMDSNRDGVVTRPSGKGTTSRSATGSQRRRHPVGRRSARGPKGRHCERLRVGRFRRQRKVTTQEWRRAFTQLDANRDGHAERRRTLVTQHSAGADASVPGRARPRPHRRASGGAKTATNEGRGISRASGSSKRPMRAIAANWARATSTRAAIAKASGRATRKGSGRAADLGAPTGVGDVWRVRLEATGMNAPPFWRRDDDSTSRAVFVAVQRHTVRRLDGRLRHQPRHRQRQLALISEAQEIEMGRGADKDVVSSIGCIPTSRCSATSRTWAPDCRHHRTAQSALDVPRGRRCGGERVCDSPAASST